MILVQENNLDNYLRQQRLTTPPTVAKMAQLDGEMKTVLGPVYMEAGMARLARQPGNRDFAV